jgi:predicted ATPase
MRLTRYSVRNLPPVKFFEASDLSEVVVFAGANGVGKTTLLNGLLNIFRNPVGSPNISIEVSATCSEEAKAWGGGALNTNNPAEAQTLRSFLQRQQKRGQLRGGVLNFDSARAFDQIQPYNWTWMFADPFEEPIGWDVSFQPTKGRFQDVMHALVRKVRSQKEEIAKRALELKKQGAATMNLSEFGDPIARFKDAFSKLLPGKIMQDIEEQQQVIKYIQDGQTLELWRLSSGEREVVTVVFDFLLRSPRDCVVVFDEPELHLHPELSYRLLRTLQDVGERNQFIFCTHSPEIITASLEQSVVFVGPSKGEGVNQALPVRENEKFLDAMTTLGQSIGVISLGKRIVLIEGTRDSLDKEVYGSIIGAQYPDMVLVPVGGKDTAVGFQRAAEAVLSQTIWGVDFFMLCDGDSAARGSRSQQQSDGHLRVLSRYHLENYFLDEFVWAKVFEDLALSTNDPLRNPTVIREALRKLAQDDISYAVALKVSNYFRQLVGNVDIMPKGANGLSVDNLCASMESGRSAEATRCGDCLDKTTVEKLVREEFTRLTDALDQDDESWKSLIPGRPIIKRFSAQVKQDYGTLKRLYIRASRTSQPDPFEEIRSIFSEFANR